MKLFLLFPFLTVITLLSACFTNQPSSSSHYYQIKNESSVTVKLDFSYSGYIPTGAPTHIDMPPNNAYPPSGYWYWTNSDNSSATVSYSGAVQPSWNGILTLGNGYSASPSGTYTFKDLSPGGNPSGVSCISNSFPGNDQFCLANLGQHVSLACGWGNPSMNGTFNVYKDMKIQCKNGRKWTLTCEDNGQKCNLSETEFCVGLTQWNVGQHCTEPLYGLNPNGW